MIFLNDNRFAYPSNSLQLSNYCLWKKACAHRFKHRGERSIEISKIQPTFNSNWRNSSAIIACGPFKITNQWSHWITVWRWRWTDERWAIVNARFYLYLLNVIRNTWASEWMSVFELIDSKLYAHQTVIYIELIKSMECSECVSKCFKLNINWRFSLAITLFCQQNNTFSTIWSGIWALKCSKVRVQA